MAEEQWLDLPLVNGQIIMLYGAAEQFDASLMCSLTPPPPAGRAAGIPGTR